MRKTLCIGALVLSMAGAFWYGRQAKPEPHYRPSAVEKAQSDFVMNMNSEAMHYFKRGTDRMREAGVEYSSEQVQVMLQCADKDYNAKGNEHRLDVDEARELYEVVLNPDSYLGRVAMPRSAKSHYIVKMPPRYEPLLRTLIDYDRNGVVSADEMRVAHARIGE